MLPFEAPLWVQVFLALGAVLAPALVCAPPMFVCALIATRTTRALAPESHWTERARVWWPGLMFLNFGVLLNGVAGLGLSYVTYGALSPLPRIVHVVLSILAGVLAGQVVSYVVLRLRRAPSIVSGRISSLGTYLKVVWTQMLLNPHLVLVLALLGTIQPKMRAVDWAVWGGSPRCSWCCRARARASVWRSWAERPRGTLGSRRGPPRPSSATGSSLWPSGSRT